MRTKWTTTHKKNEKSQFFFSYRRASSHKSLHSRVQTKAVVEGERGVNTERKREKETRDRQRETFRLASGGFRRGFLSFSLNDNKQKKRQKKRIREKF